jgi:hypothetical protein
VIDLAAVAASLADRARTLAIALLAAAALADVMVWVYDAGRASALAAGLADFGNAPETAEEPE